MIYLLLASFLWGTSFIAGKFAYQYFDPFLLVQLRMLIASFFVIGIFLKNKKNIIKTFNDHKLSFFILSFLIYPATFLLQFLGLKYTSASSATTMIGIEPFMIVLLGYIFFKNATTRFDWILAILAFFGVGMVVWSSNNSVNIFGCFLVLLSTIVVAIWVLFSKSMLKDADSNLFTCITILLGTLCCLPFTLIFSDFNFEKVTSISFLPVLYLGVGCSFFAAKLWNLGLQKFSANNSGVFLALEPIFGVLLSVLLLNEVINGINLVGVVIVIFAALLSQLIKAKN